MFSNGSFICFTAGSPEVNINVFASLAVQDGYLNKKYPRLLDQSQGSYERNLSRQRLEFEHTMDKVLLMYNFVFLHKFTCLCCLQVGAFSVLKELVVVLPDCLADHIGSLIPGIEKALCVSKTLC